MFQLKGILRKDRKAITPMIRKTNDDGESSVVTIASSDEDDSFMYSSSPPKSVTFDKIIIREYALTIGDNPSCSIGAPISLSWKYSAEHIELTLDEYEQSCENCGRPKRISVRDRHRILLGNGVPISQIMGAAKDCQLAQKQRRQTIDSLIEVPRVRNRFAQAFINFLFM
jgi:hypothetical protein